MSKEKQIYSKKFNLNNKLVVETVWFYLGDGCTTMKQRLLIRNNKKLKVLVDFNKFGNYLAQDNLTALIMHFNDADIMVDDIVENIEKH